MSISLRTTKSANTIPADNSVTVSKIADGAVTLDKLAPEAITPKIVSINYPGDDTAADVLGGQTITLLGSGFQTGASVLIGDTLAPVVTVVSDTTVTFTAPPKAAGTYILYLINTDGGTAIAVPGIQYSGLPTWTTSAGSLGTYIETFSINLALAATGDSPITYILASGTLPSGVTLNSATGQLTGSAPAIASSTTYNFTIRAQDPQNQDTSRNFSLTINPDVVTWSSPANNATYTQPANSQLSAITLSASADSGSAITYSANTLPTGVTLSGNTISGTPTNPGTINTVLSALASLTGKSATRTITFQIQSASVPVSFLIVGGGGSGGRADGYPGLGGGGGAGGLIETTATVSASSLTIVVGSGGAAGAPVGSNGGNSTVTGTGVNLVAIGGGRGGWFNDTGAPGAAGGSGGGGGSTQGGSGGGSGGAAQQPTSASGGFGNPGRAGNTFEAGPGGGAGGTGAVSSTSPGRSVTVPGYSATTYASALQSSNGSANTGQGSGYLSGARTGGSGIVVLWYPDGYPAATTTGNPTVTVSGGFRVYRFTGSGSITF